MATFGKTDDGTNPTTSTLDRKKVSAASPASSGTVTSITIRGAAASSSTAIKGVIYADSGGSPGALLAVSDEITVDSTTVQEWTGTFSGVNQIDVTSGTTYWIGWLQQSPGFVIRRDGNTGDSQTNTDTYSDGPTDPFGATTAEAGPVAVYVTYTEAAAGGGGGIVPVVRSASSSAEDNTPTVEVAKPAGLALGDFLLAFTESDADGNLTAMTAPSGFIQLGSQAPDSANNIPPAKVWGKVAEQVDIDATTFGFPDYTGANCSVVLVAIETGTFDPVNPVTTLLWGSQGNAANASITAPSITGAVDALLVTGHMADTGGTVRSFSSGPSGMSLVHQSVAGASTYTRIAVYRQQLVATGATGDKTAVLSATPDGWAAVALMVNPAPLPPSDVARLSGGFLSLL